jgi:hypothetical protein
MAPNIPLDSTDDVKRFFTSLKSMNELDKLEIYNVVRGLLSPTQRDICFTGMTLPAESVSHSSL